MNDEPDIGFFPDYHEHEDFQPAMLALSHLVVQWNWAEHNFNVLLWQYVGDFNTGSMYTAGLGNQSRADALLALARLHEKDGEIVDRILFSIKAFGRIKDNRNALVHAHSVTYHYSEEPKPRWVRGSKNPKNIHVYCFADISDIVSNLDAACQLAMFLGEIMVYYASPLRPKPSLAKFPLPDSLVPHPVPRTEREASPQSRPE
ncbi:hypothetical protein G4G27_00685 [Sphingomonas sp. So64.6b]|uniref:hypothetical protein n=1 Tax=Sphingomonas sp. So64.6b TaxID=2997354 RepID=UPI001604530C|nr:hypothetical protein [Sphingomonas sp. So64.6b]QNA82686.1 hypothetical protein G4G27_00685 [Sphingomonas sp. So64.6b]